MPSHPVSYPLREAIRLGWGGAKANFRPGLALWLIGLAVILCYQYSPAVAGLFDQVGRAKESYAPAFAMLSTALFGSLVPWLLQLIFLPAKARQPLWQVPPLFVFWAILGWEMEHLYNFQAALFGTDSSFQTIAAKTLFDQLLWSPFLASPQVLLCYLFIEEGCSPTRFREALKRKNFFARVIPLIIANWAVWFPAVALIYFFPLPLQLPLQNLILAIWCLIVRFFTKNA